jgi:hypothetical protein
MIFITQTNLPIKHYADRHSILPTAHIMQYHDKSALITYTIKDILIVILSQQNSYYKQNIMKTNPKSKIGTIIIALILSCIFPFVGQAQTVIDIQVAPNVLNLQSQGQVVTIHTDLAFWTVLGSTVTLNGEEIESWKADNNGFFVAKFNMEAIKDLPLNIDEYNTLELKGEQTDGTEFIGVSEVLVIDKKGKN